jgi:8-oxo-dGTP pyrophosphatase MutT (NUDIX family)
VSLHDDAVLVLKSYEHQDELRQLYLDHLAAHPDGMWKACEAGHVTASALVVEPEHGRVLLTLHKKLGMWLQMGGHCEPQDTSLEAAALREATEESGIDGLTIDSSLAALHVHPVTCSLGVPTRHLDMQFVVHAPAGAEIARSDESLDLRWWPLDALPDDTDFGLTQLAAAARNR